MYMLMNLLWICSFITSEDEHRSLTQLFEFVSWLTEKSSCTEIFTITLNYSVKNIWNNVRMNARYIRKIIIEQIYMYVRLAHTHPNYFQHFGPKGPPSGLQC